jgi:hypothetical protein
MAADVLRVAAPLVVLRTTFGTMVHLYEGAVVPKGADPAHRDQLIESGMLKRVPVKAEAAREPTVQEVLDEVGDDAEKAAEALAAEVEARGDKARSTLVKALEEVIDSDDSDSDDSDA